MLRSMPVTRGAIRKQRADKQKDAINLKIKQAYKAAVSLMRKKASAATLKKLFKTLDIASKRKVIHKNKAARLKSRLSRLLGTKKK